MTQGRKIIGRARTAPATDAELDAARRFGDAVEAARVFADACDAVRQVMVEAPSDEKCATCEPAPVRHEVFSITTEVQTRSRTVRCACGVTFTAAIDDPAALTRMLAAHAGLKLDATTAAALAAPPRKTASALDERTGGKHAGFFARDKDLLK